MPVDSNDDLEETRIQLAALAAAWVVNAAVSGALIYALPLYNKTPYHTSALTGEAWVLELLNGHPERIRNELGVHKEVFGDLLKSLRDAGQGPSKHISLEEQLAIFLYTCVTGLSLRHVGERFQHSTETISKYFRQMLLFFSSPPFYSDNVRLPTADTPLSQSIQDDPLFYPFFKDTIGAIDGTHINANVTLEERQASRNRKGGVTQNCLAACNFDMKFTYIFSGWDGSTADSTMFHDARLTDLPVPHGKYFLADAGFPLCDVLLIPFRGVRYHLAEWGRADLRPANPQELFNLRHSMARNVIERIFGVLKRRFRILIIPPELEMHWQARLVAALAAIHNFIRDYDPTDIDDIVDPTDPEPGTRVAELAQGIPSAAERDRAHQRQDRVAQEMWVQYAACHGI